MRHVKTELPDQPEGFEKNLAGHLRMAEFSVDESNRDFRQAQATAMAEPIHLDLEPESGRANIAQVKICQ